MSFSVVREPAPRVAAVLKAVNLREALTEPTHAGLVAAQGRLLATLSRDIAAEISKLAR